MNFGTLSELEREEFSRCVKRLLNQTFENERIYDQEKGRPVVNQNYRKLESLEPYLIEYFKLIDMSFVINRNRGVAYIEGKEIEKPSKEPFGLKAQDSQRSPLSLKTTTLTRLSTIYLLLFRLIYEETQKEASIDNIVYVNFNDINEKIGTFQLLKDLPSAKANQDAISLLIRHQIIKKVTRDLVNGDIYIVYPSISILLKDQDIKVMIEFLGGNNSDTSEES